MPSPPTIDQILTPLSPAQARKAISDILIALSIPANEWAPGGVASSLLTGCGNVLSMLSGQLANGLAGFFVTRASGANLQLLAFYRYGVPWSAILATFATGNVTLVNATGAIYNVGIGNLTVSNPTTGAQYTNTTAFTLGAFATLSIPVEATSPGSASNSSPGTVTNLVTALAGVTCSNPVAITGRDPLTDSQLQALCINSVGIASLRGPRGAYKYAISVATNSVTGNPVNINRNTVSDSSHTGNVAVVVASPAGAPDPNDVTGVATSIETLVRPMGVVVTVTGATGITYVATITPYVVAPSGVDVNQLLTNINASLNDYFSTEFPIGGDTVTDDLHPGGFTGVVASGVYGAIATGVATIPSCRLIAARGGVDLALTHTQVAQNGVLVNAPVLSPTAS